MSRLRLSLFTVFFALGFCVVAACSSNKPKPDEKQEQKEKKVQHELPTNPEVSKYIFGGDAPIVAKIDFGQWDSLSSGLEKRFGMVKENRTYGKVDAMGPLPFVFESLGQPGVPESLAADRPMYLRVDIIGDEAVQKAASVGLPAPPDGPWPTGIHVRALVPAEDPGALTDSLAEGMANMGGPTGHGIQPGDEFVRVDVVYAPSPVFSKDRIQSALEQMADPEATGSEHRATPTMKRFLESDAPINLYSNLSDMRRLAIGKMALEGAAALTHASEENRQRITAKVSAMIGGFGLLIPQSVQSFEDASMTIRGDGADGLVVELGGTRTARGQKLYDSTATSVEVPSFSDRAFEGTESLGTLAFGLDWSAIADAKPAEVDLFGHKNIPLRSGGEIAEQFRYTGIWGYLSLFSTPEHFARMVHRTVESGSGYSLPDAVSARLAYDDSKKRFPIRAGFIAAFEPESKSRNEVKTRLERLLSTASRQIPMKLDSKVEAPDEGPIRLSIGLNTTVDSLDGDESTSIGTGPDARIESATLGKLVGAFPLPRGMKPVVQTISKMGTIRLENSASKAERRLRLHIGDNALDEPTVEKEYTASELAGDFGCQRKMLLTADAVLEAINQSDGDDAGRARHIAEDYDSALDKCRTDSSNDPELLEWARGRLRWVLANRAEGYLHADVERMKTCIGNGNVDKDERRDACRDIKRKNKDEFFAEIQETRKLATTMYESACDLGDQAGCAATKNGGLPEIPDADALDEALSEM